MTPDVIIVGSGPAGVSAAWPLIQAGLGVLMVDSSSPEDLPPTIPGTIGELRAHPGQWRHRFGADLAGSAAAADVSPKFATPLARRLTGSYPARLGVETHGFWAAGSLSPGGLSNIWGGVAEVYDAADLAGFPFPPEVMAPSYRAVMDRIGVCEQPPAIPEEDGFRSPVQEVWRRRARLPAATGLSLRPARNAILTAPQDGREACALCGLCLWGCANRSIYNSAHELPALRRHANFTYLPHTRVAALGGAGGVHVLQAERDGAGLTLSAPRVVLAAGTIATTALVLARLGLADTPVRLLTNPVGAIAFLMPKLIAQRLPDRSFSLGQLTYTVPLSGEAGYAAGVLYGADTLPLGVVADRLPLSRPVALRTARALMPALVLATCYVPGRFSRNTLRLAAGAVPRVVIEGERTGAADRAVLASARTLARALRRTGVLTVPGSLTLSQPGTDAHYSGTIPMGGEGPVACAADGELRGVPGLYIADGAALSDLPAKHCTLTIMANADRIGRGMLHS